MAVTLTVDQLRNALRVEDSAEEVEIVTRLLAVGTAMVEKYAPDAPDVIQDEATIRIAGYLFDAPSTGRGTPNALRNSSASALLSPYRVQRADVLTAEA